MRLQQRYATSCNKPHDVYVKLGQQKAEENTPTIQGFSRYAMLNMLMPIML